MRIALAADHAGYPLKEMVAEWLRREGHEVLDLGTHSTAPVDYPDYARAVGEAVRDGQAERGIVICGSGVGACIAANKVKGVRAALCHDPYSARQGVEHTDMNVLCLGARVIGPVLAQEVIKAFLSASFSGEERHRRRLAKVRALEEGLPVESEAKA
jgi:RpiB/LacA/LacB family sugar-phosphate isomerase|nr:putative sugar phosphate isomerase YwlF [uncultured bacterium]